ncbi:MAG: GNAT family N-acetyltransferase, partial [Deltaproteobacteria bacterium]
VDLLLTEPVTVEGTTQWLRDGKVEVRCLLEKGLLKGSVILYLDRDGEVAFFAGEPGKGIGTRLLAIVENVAREKGLGRLWARVLTSNEPARRAFLKAGYELDGSADGSWRGKPYEVHVFRRRIPVLGPERTATVREGKRDFIPFALPSIGEEEIAEVADSLRSGWLTTGPKAKRFEEEFAASVGAPFALAVNSGTAAMHLALEAIGLAEGEYVATSPFTFTATAEVIRYFNAHPLFVDVDPATGNIDPSELERVVARARREGKRIRAVLPVHFGGRACAMDDILSIARNHSLKVVEDAAHAFPCSYGGRKVGTIGDLTCFSFYATKTITTGEGGMVTTADGEFERRIRMMRLHGITRDVWDRYTSSEADWFYEVAAPGFKYNLTDIAAAIGIHQLRKAETFRLRREAIGLRYTEAFSGLPVRLPGTIGLPPGSIHAWHLYVLRLDLDRLSIDRDGFIERMAKMGIGTSVHFIPLHLHPYWKERYGFSPEDFPASLDLFRRCVSLPIYPLMSDEDVDRVIEADREILTATTR